MEAFEQARTTRTTTIAQRTVKCAFCHDTIPFTVAIKTKGVCRICIAEIAELGWRVVYDREQNFGEIPANLRIAYNL
jgi:hypothetical protein